MSALIGKLVPTAIVAAVVAWYCWPHLNAAKPLGGVQEPDDLLHIADSLLSPAIAPSSGRDPFQPMHVPEPATAQVASVPIEEPTMPDPVPEEPVDILGTLALDATFIHGDRRLALINGRICSQGDSLSVSSAAAEPCTISQISVDKVLIQHRGRTMELKYRPLLSTTGPSGAVEATEQTPPKTRQTAESDVP